jgi:3,4-dihydroxy 2-butanone 4-phosphate synthase/GTP cyclohydrolase II
VVLDDHDQQEAHLIFAAECAVPALVAFTIRHTAGFLCVALTGARADELHLPPMTHGGRHGGAYSVTVDAKTGITTGISAADRARTAFLLAAKPTTPDDLVRPGHVVPLRAEPEGLFARRGHAEAAIDLAALAGLQPAAGVCALVSKRDPTTMAHGPEGRDFAQDHDLPILTIDEIVTHRMRRESVVERCADLPFTRDAGPFRVTTYCSRLDGREHLALVYGDPENSDTSAIRIHRECALSSLATSTCHCRAEFDASMETIRHHGQGIIVLLRSGATLATCEATDASEEQQLSSVAESILADLGHCGETSEWHRFEVG